MSNASPASTRSPEASGQAAFPPSVVVEVKRIACECPMDAGVPLARWALPDLHREVVARGLVATISGTTLWRWLDADAIRPWRHRRHYLLAFQHRYHAIATPFRWTFTRADLHQLLAKLAASPETERQAAC